MLPQIFSNDARVPTGICHCGSLERPAGFEDPDPLPTSHYQSKSTSKPTLGHETTLFMF